MIYEKEGIHMESLLEPPRLKIGCSYCEDKRLLYRMIKRKGING